MQKRIVFGSLLLSAMVGILVLDGYLDHRAEKSPWTYRDWSIDRSAAFADRFPALPVTAVVLTLVLVGWLEFGDLARQAGRTALRRTGLFAVSVLVLGVFLRDSLTGIYGPFATSAPTWLMASFAALAVLPVLVVMAVFAGQMIRGRLDKPFERLGTTLLGIMWLGLGGSAIVLLRLESSTSVLVIFLAAAKFTDIGAYFTGALVGKHRMIPWLSPGKSWEGLVGGLATSAGTSVLLAWLLLDGEQPPLWAWLIFGPVVGLAGQFGDLCESLLKRAAGAKDSGSLVPEFGGVLDMLDSVLLSAPVAFIMLMAFRSLMFA
jgi:phosphatidate cytidylyltransferase